MKKVVLAAVSLLLAAGVIAAQTTNKTRPRIVRTPTPAPREIPSIQNDDGPGTSERKSPVLIDNTSTIPRTVGTPPPLVIDSDDDEVINIDTNLVTLPVTVLDRQGRFIPGLIQRDFRIYEDGVEQQIGYFASVEKPFTVVLMLDTSPSTAYKIEEIRSAAISFVNQLRSNDEVMVVSFDRGYKVLAYPTSNRMRLTSAIRQAEFGDGTSIYDAVNRTITDELDRVPGRKAIVLFTDGVDTTSKRAGYDSTIRAAEEADALIYPIRYDTSKQYQTGRRVPSRRRGSTGSIIG
ncbi:MAG: VWA domain-containing protein, partial [Acidobacteriota bacterium]|nr:VWA domain-containing protein [Acidobacteriota bacterium]